MKIERIETYLAPHLAIVRVMTDDGAEGFGQTSTYGADVTVDVLHTMVAPSFLGEDPWEVDRLVQRCLTRQYKFPGTFICRALCGIDTAIYDLLGRVTSQPVYKLLGGAARREVPMYASSMSRSISPAAEGQRLADLVSAHGFRAVKVRVGSVMGRDVDAAPKRTEQLIPTIREALGDDVDINADANGGFSVGRAIQVGRLMEQYRYFHFEEPCPYQQIEATAQVAAALDMQVAGGEQDNVLDQFYRMIQMRAVDVIQPDVGYIGGIGRMRRVAEMAENAGIPCTPHCANRSLLQVFTLHLAAAMPACSQYQEWSIETDQAFAEGIYEPELKVVNGVVPITDKPGWGIDILPSFLKNTEVRASKAGQT
jgi:L-alanine-DL-glutamate epimerase-like enolase superfamily enzyme